MRSKTKTNLISKLLLLETTIDIPMIISYITELERSKFGLRVVTPNLQILIHLDLSKKKTLDLQLRLLKLRLHFWTNLREIGAWKVRS